MKVRKKPVTVDAWRWLINDHQEADPVWIRDALGTWPDIGGIAFELEHPDGSRICIASLEGVMIAFPGDYIIRGVNGELYPCKPDIFDQTYEETVVPVFAIAAQEFIDTLLETMEILSDPEWAEKLRAAVTDIQAGRVVDHEQVKEQSDG